MTRAPASRTAQLAVGLGLAVALVGDAARAAEVTDPVGDTLGIGPIQLDATLLAAHREPPSLRIRVELFGVGPTDPVVGLIEIDADGDPATGGPSFVGALCPDETGLGVDQRVSLFGSAGGQATLTDADWNPIGTVPVERRPGEIELVVPLPAAAAPRLAAILGPEGEATDCVPNGGALTAAASVLEIPTLGLPGLAALLALLALAGLWRLGR